MVYDEQPLAILGSVDSAATHLAEQVVAKANLPLVSPVSTDPSVTLAGVSWAFSCAPSDAAIACVLVDHLLRTAATGTNRFALLTTTEHESRMTARVVLRECSRRGRLPAFRFEAQPGTHAIERQIAATADARPDAVLIIASPEDSARLTIAVRAKLPGVTIFGAQAMSRSGFLELAAKAAEGVRFPMLIAGASTGSARAQQFRDSFLAAHGRGPDYMAALTYDSTRLLLEAIKTTGPSRARIRETLGQLSPWQGIAGVIDFDGTGQNTRSDIAMATVENGIIVPLRNADVLHAALQPQL
jgi:branched-chain amino acid transport system substrate-binding protein